MSVSCFLSCFFFLFFFFNETATTESYTLSLHDALPIWAVGGAWNDPSMSIPLRGATGAIPLGSRSEEHTSELQSRLHLVCRLLLAKNKAPARPSRPAVDTARHTRTSISQTD